MDVYIVMAFPKRAVKAVFAEPDAALDFQEQLGPSYRVLQTHLLYGQHSASSPIESRWLSRKDYNRREDA